ncbi:MAG: RNA 2',3'-cyclic phosphodiesterase [Bacteroidetes bacterium]|nr:RNA 2',3'-cyclic phosphodiesterase [Bacteroidota bacterium]
MFERTFIAQHLSLSKDFLNIVDSFKRDLNGLDVKWVENHNLHLTLAFLGNTSDKQSQEIKAGLHVISQHFTTYEIRVSGLGAFRSLKDPQVLWVGISSGKTLGLMYSEIQDLIEHAGFILDPRRFKPHLTIGRVKKCSSENNLIETVEKYTGIICETVCADTIDFLKVFYTHQDQYTEAFNPVV